MNEAQLIPVQLPNILSLQACLSRARAWVTDLEEIQVRIILASSDYLELMFSIVVGQYGLAILGGCVV